MHHLALAISKETLDENRFRNIQKTTDHPAPDFQVRDRVCFKNKQPGKWDLKWGAGYRIVHIDHNEHCLHIKIQGRGKTSSWNVKDVVYEPLLELWNIDTQSGRAGKFINHPANLPTITLHNT